jgi:hypothetical protein
VSHYRTGRVGAWELKRQFQPVLRGYFRELQAAADNYVLTRDYRVWMSLSPVETESLAPHVPFMHGMSPGSAWGSRSTTRCYARPCRGLRYSSVTPRSSRCSRRSGIPIGPVPTASGSSRPTPAPGDRPRRSIISMPDIWDKLGAPEAAADTRAMCRNVRPKSAVYWGMEANFVSFLAHNRCRPPVMRSQFQAWAARSVCRSPPTTNRAWRERIPDVATRLIFGGSPG